LEIANVSLQSAVDFLHLLLDGAIFLFLWGIIFLIPPNLTSSLVHLSPTLSNFSVIFVVAPFHLWYLIVTLSPLLRHTIFSTTTFRFFRHPTPIFKLALVLPVLSSKPPWNGEFSGSLDFDFATVYLVDQFPLDKFVKSQTPLLDIEILTWLLRSLHHDSEIERFLEGIPGFYNSTLVKLPEERLRSLHEDTMPLAILSFIHTTLSSAALSDEIKQKRIKLFLGAVESDPYLLERTFFHILSGHIKSTIFYSIDVALIGDQFASKTKGSVQFLSKWIIAVAISYVTAQELRVDERWLHIIDRQLSFAIADPTSNKQISSMKLVNLVWLVKEFDFASIQQRGNIPLENLLEVGNFRMENDASQYQDVFCDQWNELLGLASGGVVLPRIRTIYNALHSIRNDTLIGPADAVSSYPRCNIAGHLHSPHLRGVSTTVGRLPSPSPSG
jgi:hypothetical protein